MWTVQKHFDKSGAINLGFFPDLNKDACHVNIIALDKIWLKTSGMVN